MIGLTLVPDLSSRTLSGSQKKIVRFLLLKCARTVDDERLDVLCSIQDRSKQVPERLV
jgi:hypothetical protein